MPHHILGTVLSGLSIVICLGLLAASVFLYIFPYPAKGAFGEYWWPSAVTSLGLVTGSVWYLSIANHVEYIRSPNSKNAAMSIWVVLGLVAFNLFFGVVMEDTLGARQSTYYFEDGRTTNMDADLTVNLPKHQSQMEDYSTLPAHIYRIAHTEGLKALGGSGYGAPASFSSYPLGEAMYTSSRTYGMGRHPLTEPAVNYTSGWDQFSHESRRGTHVRAECTDATANWSMPIGTDNMSTDISHPDGSSESDAWRFLWFPSAGRRNQFQDPVLLQRTRMLTRGHLSRPIVDISVAGYDTHTILFSQTSANTNLQMPMLFHAMECRYRVYETVLGFNFAKMTPRGEMRFKADFRPKEVTESSVIHPGLVEVRHALSGWDGSGGNKWAMNGPLAEGLNAAFFEFWSRSDWVARSGMEGYTKRNVDVPAMISEIMSAALEGYFSIRRSHQIGKDQTVRMPLNRVQMIEGLGVGGHGLSSVLIVAFMALVAILNLAFLLARVYSENAAVGLDRLNARIAKCLCSLVSLPATVWRWVEVQINTALEQKDEEEERSPFLPNKDGEKDDDAYYSSTDEDDTLLGVVLDGKTMDE